MTVSVVTGKPGHGKTLYAVTRIEKLAKEQNRKVYYNGIPDLKLDWELLEDATQWHNPDHVPDGAIIVIDEAQRTFPPRSTGSRVPAHVQPFDTHRHRGLDVYLITQDPMLIDSFARNLAGEHLHVLRPFGTQQAKVYRWEHVVDPDSRSERNLAVDTQLFRYPKESFELYKSATVHTVKRKLPWKLAVGVPLLLGVLVLSVVIGYKTLSAFRDKPESGTGKQESSGLISTSSGGDGQPISKEDYLALNTVRVPGVPESAPKYDDLSKPSVLPVLSACVKSESACNCYTQQGTKIPDVPADMCLDFVSNGTFIAYDDKTLGRTPQKQIVPDRRKELENELAILKLQDELELIKKGIHRASGGGSDKPEKES